MNKTYPAKLLIFGEYTIINNSEALAIPLRRFGGEWSFDKTGNLLSSINFFPLAVLKTFTKASPEEVRAMFIELFDEGKEIIERIDRFKIISDECLKKYGDGAKNHFQNENAISIYLWLRYPDKYYIYKFGAVKKVAEELESELTVKKGSFAENFRNCLSLYNEICAELQLDDEIVKLLNSQLNPNCFPDSQFRTLTIDIAYYIGGRYYTEEATDVIGEENPISSEKTFEQYNKSTFLKEVFISENRYDTLISVLKNKKNIILQGAPGVGKTFAAKRLAFSMMRTKDENRVEFVQFHQNYSYEDFIMGYKPVNDGFELKLGIFYRFCQKAENQPEKDFFFIIDEINRGNLSKIFGELLMLIEQGYRGTKATLAYNGQLFAVPENLHIIGMMNTADRSLAMIDYALRRRFSFFEMDPGFESQGFISYQKSLKNETFDELVDKVKELNKEISQDTSLGKGFCIGHSYFTNRNSYTENQLREIVDYDILPMIEEYWFDNTEKFRQWRNKLQGIFQ